MKVKIEGSYDLRFEVNFWVMNAGGKMIHTNIINVVSLLDALAIIEKFEKVRAGVPTSSRALFGGGYPAQSLEWLACHSCLVEIYDAEDDLIVESFFVQHPYLEKINNSVC